MQDFTSCADTEVGAGEIFSLLSALLIAGLLVFGEDSLSRMRPITVTVIQTAALIQCSCPVITAFFSWLILGESLSAAGIAGAVVILLCIVIVADIMLRDDVSFDKSKSSLDI